MKFNYCPVCKRDILPPERLFDSKFDNHVDRCHKEKGFPLYPSNKSIKRNIQKKSEEA